MKINVLLPGLPTVLESPHRIVLSQFPPALPAFEDHNLSPLLFDCKPKSLGIDKILPKNNMTLKIKPQSLSSYVI